jgi:hypothetical protein
LRGFDCSGLTRWVYSQVGVSLPHYSVAPHPGAPVRFGWMRGWLSSSFYGARRLRLAG